MIELYRSVMDSDRNPLNVLPRAQQFQIMVVLSLMWTAIFCAAAGAWLWYEELVVGHMLFAVGVLITGMTFRGAPRARNAIYRDHPKNDGTARYDDVWGA